MTLEKAKQLLDEEYERVKWLEYVKNPLAYALYQVWKKADNKICTEVVEKRILPICAVRKIHDKFSDEEKKHFIKRKMAVDLAEYLMESGFIHYSEDCDGDITTIMAMFNIVDERSKNGT